MAVDARVRISVSTGEFEVEGTEAFVAQYDSLIQDILKRLADSAVTVPVPRAEPELVGAVSPVAVVPTPQVADMLPEFGEAMHRLPKGTSGTDYMLVAGYYASRRTSDRTFATADASKLLVEQGIKLANPSQSLKTAMDAKKVFKTGKSYKLSREGNDRVTQLLGLGGTPQ